MLKVPEHWKLVKLKEVANLVRSKVNPQNQPNKVFNYLSIGNIERNTGQLIGFVPTPGREIKSIKHLFTVQDVLYSRLRPNLNKVFLPDFEGICATDLLPLRPGPYILKEYLGLYLRSPFVVKYAASRMHGIQLPRLSTDALMKLDVLLPSMKVQRKIVARAQSILGRSRVAKQKLRRILELTKRLRMAILSKAVRGNLTERSPNDKPAEILLDGRETQEKSDSRKIGTKGTAMPYAEEDLPRGWVYSTLSQIGEIITGTTPSKKRSSYYGKKHPFFKPGDLDAGYFVEVSVDGLSDEGIKRARMVPPRSVLVTCIGATIGKSGFTRVAGAFNQQINAIIPYQEIMPEYLYFVTISPEFQRSIRQSSSSTTLPILNKTRFSNLPIPIPPIREQERIVNEIEASFASIDRLDESVKRAARSLETMDRTLISMAIFGRL